ncbi:hypothetical protein BC829DRAFT_127575 [Chytridium lagenaria]|nr:hypothetical protein BC829DRAFT_127575 [Chytridium lagenaria]
MDPSGKLAHAFGKDVAYQSELETIFRAIGYDPIIHIFNYEDVEEALSSLSLSEDVIFNACLGREGAEVAELIAKLGFQNMIGLNARFFEECQNRDTMHALLSKNNLPVPLSCTCDISKNLEEEMAKIGIGFPVYVKHAMNDHLDEGFYTGQKIENLEALKEMVGALPATARFRIEEFIVGTEYRVLVAGDARDPNADVIVFPPALFSPGIRGPPASKFGLFRRPTMPIIDFTDQSHPLHPAKRTFRPLRPDEVFLDMDLRDIARRGLHSSPWILLWSLYNH